MKIRARRHWYTDSVGLAFLGEWVGHKLPVVTGLTLEKFEEGSEIPDTCVLNRTEAQLLMDELWNCGLRPSEGSGSAGAMAAVQEHLKDMRRLVFKD